jgi:uncharacterized protein YkwD
MAACLWVDGAVARDRMGDEVLAEINFARTQPQAYARWLDEEAGRSGSWGAQPWARQDPGAVDEAIDFLMRQKPLPPLAYDERLAAVARGYVRDQGRTREQGHVAPDGRGFSQRIRSAGVHAGIAAEGISYGQDSPPDVVRQLIVDSGVRSRGHRRDIFGSGYQAAGVSCGDHARYGVMCVIEYAGAIMASR